MVGVGCNDTTTVSTCGLGLALWREKPLENTDQKMGLTKHCKYHQKIDLCSPAMQMLLLLLLFGGGGGGGGEDTILPSLKILPRFANLQRVRELQGLGRGGHSLDVWYHVLVG